MTFAAFVQSCSGWFSSAGPAAVLTGSCTDESLSRFWSINFAAGAAFLMTDPGRRQQTRVTRTTCIRFMTGKPLTPGPGLPVQLNAAPLCNLINQADVPLRHMRVCRAASETLALQRPEA